MNERQDRILNLIMIGVFLLSMFLAAGKGAEAVSTRKVECAVPEEKKKLCVVIDSGHGGDDPGKVGINGALEKEVNLQIAKKLKAFLEAEDLTVIMTREGDQGLYEETAKNKKRQDMNARVRIIEDADPVLVVSIHQNSYHEENVKGAQVFYYQTSQEGKRLAACLQKQLRVLDAENKREEKGNDSYFLLKKVRAPIVIAECGFLSNRSEAEKLISPYYQEKIAWRIHLGIMQYISTGQTEENVIKSARWKPKL